MTTDVANPEALVVVPCPCCGATGHKPFAQERGFHAVRCDDCGLVYVNPRPREDLIDLGVRLGEHNISDQVVNVKARRDDRKISFYTALFRDLYADWLTAGRAVSWVDYGAGYGEVIQAVKSVFPGGTTVLGIEPMEHKARSMEASGLPVINAYPEVGQSKSDVISMVNIFSHVPDFKGLLVTAAANLNPGGEIFVETGNLADLERADQFFGILDLPDHLVFAGKSQMQRYLDSTGFEIVRVEERAVDGWEAFGKNIVKKALGRPVRLALPYSSAYRQLFIRARLKPA